METPALSLKNVYARGVGKSHADTRGAKDAAWIVEYCG